MAGRYAIERSPMVEKDRAPLVRKKFRRLKEDLDEYCDKDLSHYARERRRPHRTQIPGIPNVWKARMGIPSAGIGERGGMRLVYWVGETPPLVILLRAYYKAEIKDLPRKVIVAAKKRVRPL